MRPRSARPLERSSFAKLSLDGGRFWAAGPTKLPRLQCKDTYDKDDEGLKKAGTYNSSQAPAGWSR